MLKLYGELAKWWPLLSPPADYAEEAVMYESLLRAHTPTPQTLLELGSGGGNNASFMKRSFRMTLADVSEEMLRVSRSLNPECEHVHGDMRSLRLDREFDAVFVHDAIMYMTTEQDLARTFETIFLHCRPGGVALIAPDWVKETFEPTTEHDGHDGDGRALRFLEWSYDPDPEDTTYNVEYAVLLKTGRDSVEVAYDKHLEGIFPRQLWLDLLSRSGFSAKAVNDPIEPRRTLFVATKTT